MDPAAHSNLLAIAVGNTRTRLGLFRGRDLDSPQVLLNSDPAGIAAAAARAVEGVHDAVVVIAGVNPPVVQELESLLRDRVGEEVYHIGRDLPVPIRTAVSEPQKVGQDRLLCALGAYSRAGQACVVIDAGTAITVDFVDGEGVFQGGVIAPGLRMMLAALHEKTALLPRVELEAPDAARGVFGKDTKHAMLLGALNMARGLVRLTVEQYSEVYGAYPQIIATGGDAALLFSDDPVVEHLVPDLQLVGIAEACRTALGEESTDGDAGAHRAGPPRAAPRGAEQGGDDDGL